MLICNFFYLTLLPDNIHDSFVYFFFIVHGLAYSLFMSAYWPCIKFIVPSHLTTTAYGLSYSAQNIMLFLGPAVTGTIIDSTKHISGGYFWSSIFLLFISILTALVGLIIYLYDHKDSEALPLIHSNLS